MRYVGGFVLLVVLVSLPLSASAQTGEEGKEPTVEEPAPSSEPESGEPALQFQLDDAGVKVTPTRDGFYILEPTSVEPDLRKPGAPWLRLELDSAGLEITPAAERFYVVEPTELRVGLTRRAKIGIGVGVGVALALVIATAVAVSQMDFGSWE